VSEVTQAPPSGIDALSTLARGATALLAYLAFGAVAARLLGVVPGGDAEGFLLSHGCGCVAFCVAASLLPPSAGLAPARGAMAAPGFYALFLLVWVPFVLFVYGWVVHRLSVSFEPQPQLAYFAAADRDRWQFYAALATVVGIGPLAEEFAFRGYVRDLLAAASGQRAALWGTAALFGVFHGAVFALPVGLLGLLFGWLRERYACLSGPFVAHALHNGLTVALILVAPDFLDQVYR